MTDQKDYTAIEVTIKKTFYIDNDAKNGLPIHDQIARNINGWNWADAKIETLITGQKSWNEVSLFENFLDPCVR